MNVAVVQPIFESLALFAWCFMAGVLPDMRVPEPPREQVIGEATKKVMNELAWGVSASNSNHYLEQFSPELREEIRPKVEAVLTSPKKHFLGMDWKMKPVSVGSYEATYTVKILTLKACPSDYQENIEYATVTFGPKAANDDSKFFADGVQSATPERWEITKWETEKVVPYDRNKDR
jgi:hypothetical protein